MRTLLIPLIVTAACTPPMVQELPPPTPDTPLGATSLDATLATLAGSTGVVTTLARYDDGTPHPGTNAIDVGAAGGSEVWHQIDYLPASVGGGYLYVTRAQEAGRCSQFDPGSPYYNGHKLVVLTYFLVEGGWRVHRAAYQHTEPRAPLNTWLHWNNAGAAEPLWPEWSAEVVLGNQAAGGLLLATVFPVSGEIRNGPGGALCTTGTHLHQEGDGYRAPRRSVGEHVSARYSDMHMFSP